MNSKRVYPILILSLLVAFLVASALWVNSVVANTNQTGTVTIYLPILVKEYKTVSGIYGTVTFNGEAAVGVPLELYRYNGADYAIQSTTTTDANGNYSFVDAPSLVTNEHYIVEYNQQYSQLSDTSRLSFWDTKPIDSYIAGNTVKAGDFDLANIQLVSPNNDVSVSLPNTFSWVKRPTSPTDSYIFSLFEPGVYEVFDQTSELGYVGSYNMSSLPLGFELSTTYGWYVAVVSPDGGYGESYYYRKVTFTNSPSFLLAPLSSPEQRLSLQGRYLERR